MQYPMNIFINKDILKYKPLAPIYWEEEDVVNAAPYVFVGSCRY